MSGVEWSRLTTTNENDAKITVERHFRGQSRSGIRRGTGECGVGWNCCFSASCWRCARARRVWRFAWSYRPAWTNHKMDSGRWLERERAHDVGTPTSVRNSCRRDRIAKTMMHSGSTSLLEYVGKQRDSAMLCQPS